MSRSGATKKRPTNKLSQHLYEDETATLVELLMGSNCFSLGAGVVQLLGANKAGRGWDRIDAGVVCFVKDYTIKAYFIRLFDISRKVVLFEQMLYSDFQIRSPNNVDRLLTFEGDKRVFGLNFAFADEARQFKSSLDRCYEQQQKQKRRGSASMADEGYHEGSSTASSGGAGYGSTAGASQVRAQGYAGRQTQISSNNIVIPTSNPMAGDLFTTSAGGSSSKGGGRRVKLRKGGKTVTVHKSDISLPTNFEHRVHVGWGSDKGWQSNAHVSEDELDPNIKQLLDLIGMQRTQLKQEDKKFIYEFVDHHGGIDQLKKELTHQPQPQQQQQQQHHHQPPPVPPPPPSRQPMAHRQHAAPPPPPPPPRDPVPSGRPLPPTPRSAPVAVPTPPPAAPGWAANRPSDTPPPPPPPISSLPRSGAGQAPPPPPPPPPPGAAAPPPPPPPPSGSSAPPPPPSDGRSDLLKQIQEGKSLRHIEPSVETSEAACGRDKLMDSIRMGVTLRETSKEAKQERVTPPELGGIAGALARALAERRPQIESDESETESDDDEDPDDEWGD